ncbi:hypothetical protein KP509_30G011200 [Ceratopteris richardii]|uniref:Peptidase A1 domain-containing protein n=1 Tax=Ceratopteris richardii TaxID=49495 RepID=A0A8T2QZN7_CERRI|nr:hypothetical protein KP509_30G011200 [Ceratopteris richardii]
MDMNTQGLLLVLLIPLLFGHSEAVRVPIALTARHRRQPRYQVLHVSPLPSKWQEVPRVADSLGQSEKGVRKVDNSTTLILRLTHRDSPLSPFANPKASPRELLKNRLARDEARASAISVRTKLAARGIRANDLVVESVNYTAREQGVVDFAGPLMSGLKQGSGEYFIELGVGSPPRQTYMVIDTGSDIIWLQCTPCVDCYTQSGPIFDPALSSSYESLACTSPLCSMLELHSCAAQTNSCLYQVAYGDGSFTQGDFVLEALSFRGATMGGIAMGCGHDNEGLFASAAGLFGLGGGPLSFPSQLGNLLLRRVFSYCLMDRDESGFSSLMFGSAAVPMNTQFTPLLKNPNLNTYYYVSLVGISVGGSMLSIPPQAFRMDGNGGGGVIVDSGTSVTRLAEVAYGPLRSAFREATPDLPFAGGFSLFDTCYNLSGQANVRVPLVSLHFEGGAEMALPTSNYVIPVDTEGTYCLAFASAEIGAVSIIGNIQQQGFRIVFDGVSSRLGFAANQC